MNKTSSTALGFTVAIALTTGSVLVENPPVTTSSGCLQRYHHR